MSVWGEKEGEEVYGLAGQERRSKVGGKVAHAAGGGGTRGGPLFDAEPSAPALTPQLDPVPVPGPVLAPPPAPTPNAPGHDRSAPVLALAWPAPTPQSTRGPPGSVVLLSKRVQEERAREGWRMRTTGGTRVVVEQGAPSLALRLLLFLPFHPFRLLLGLFLWPSAVLVPLLPPCRRGSKRRKAGAGVGECGQSVASSRSGVSSRGRGREGGRGA